MTNKKYKPLLFAHKAIEWLSGGKDKLKGFDYVELDIRKTKDEVLVVSHDRSVKNRIHRILVDKFTHKELKQQTGKYLPKLNDILKELNGNVMFNLDLKQEGMIDDIVKIINKYKLESRVMIDSFNHEELYILSQVLPKAKLTYSFNYADRKGLLSHRTIRLIGYLGFFVLRPLWPRLVKVMAKRKPFVPAASIYWRALNPGVIDFFHKRKIPVYTFPVNSQEVFNKMLELKVDGIKTSNPELIQGKALYVRQHAEEDLALSCAKVLKPGFKITDSGVVCG